MSFENIMVHVDFGPNAGLRIELARGLAEKFESTLIGIGARDPAVPALDEWNGPDELPMVAAERKVDAELSQLEALFRNHAGSHTPSEWRCKWDQPTRFVAEQARAADLVIVARQGEGDAVDSRSAVDAGALALQLGRPLLVIPAKLANLGLGCAIVMWKDTREARRAIKDSMPLLKHARDVIIGVVDEGDRTSTAVDVVDYLKRHGIVSEIEQISLSTRHISEEIFQLAARRHADLIVAGAYGHGRAQEWMFGGVTRDILLRTPICCLLSH